MFYFSLFTVLKGAQGSEGRDGNAGKPGPIVSPIFFTLLVIKKFIHHFNLLETRCFCRIITICPNRANFVKLFALSFPAQMSGKFLQNIKLGSVLVI